MVSLGWALLSLPIQRPQSKGLQTNKMQHMHGQTTQRTPPQREAEETRRGRIGGESVETKCTSLCGAREGGISCSKLVLVDVVSKRRPENICRVYAIIEDQSNKSLITSDLVDALGATGPEEKYYLTTCSGEKEAKYGRRVTGVVLNSGQNHLR